MRGNNISRIDHEEKAVTVGNAIIGAATPLLGVFFGSGPE
eukprot:CAMPEP_0201881480 /NCGR_PEP_ID=MMETSP0902-20130614/11778_1 /ASSEMBLY_ACC=CAM_ASM_000551 /TAXON_ID=420261 /ORGANISM="Thalassiosira antarctica, Strain CCMP982" /LENGTH=39 /DNA_ID= /DNA_START= /DNA_END= /DNA_ORIENTATION=